MNRRPFRVVPLLALLLPGIAAAAERESGASAQTLRRGAYVARTAACVDCHAPWRPGPDGPAPDLSRGLSGHPQDLVLPAPPALGEGPWLWAGAATNTAFAGPWGISYAANITPDHETGIGRWREQDFIAAMRNGRHVGVGRPILPPMPWHAYRHFSDADLKALFAWLRAQPPVRNKVPEPVAPAR